jgi:4-hydroxy-3-methylbut-2-enyl diphosphate reductase IspH
MVAPTSPYHHENIGTLVIRSSKKIQDLVHQRFPNNGNEVIDDICDIITGNLERKPELSVKVQLLHSEMP